MWPTENTLLLLSIGTIPVAYAVASHLIRGLREAVVSLEVTGVLFIWLGYHLSPWLAFLFHGAWDEFLLVPGNVDTGIAFSTASMCFLILGSRWVTSQKKTSIPQSPPSIAQARSMPAILACLALGSLTLFLILSGGLEEVWVTARKRGEGQFDTVDLSKKLTQSATVLQAVLNLVLISLAAHQAASTRVLSKRYFGGVLCILVGSLPWMWSFSRGSGIGLIVLALATLLFQKGKHAILALAYIVLAVHLGMTGLSSRGVNQQGIGSFLGAAISSGSWERPYGGFIPEPRENPLDAVPAFSRRIDNTPDGLSLDTIAAFIWNLTPVPSKLISLGKTGEDLTDIMGTVGSVGLTTPALGELYYVFGFAGSAFFLLVGGVFGWFNNCQRHERSAFSYLYLALCIVSLAIGVHSNVRAMTRPLLYAGLIRMVVWKFWRSRRRSAANSRHKSLVRQS